MDIKMMKYEDEMKFLKTYEQCNSRRINGVRFHF